MIHTARTILCAFPLAALLALWLCTNDQLLWINF